jgi:DNA (cytosine-5)-methyltransferase 1
MVPNSKGLQRLTPIELERFNMFSDDHIQSEDVSDTKQGFFTGNALVVWIVEQIGRNLYQKINS